MLTLINRRGPTNGCSSGGFRDRCFVMKGRAMKDLSHKGIANVRTLPVERAWTRF